MPPVRIADEHLSALKLFEMAFRSANGALLGRFETIDLAIAKHDGRMSISQLFDPSAALAHRGQRARSIQPFGKARRAIRRDDEQRERDHDRQCVVHLGEAYQHKRRKRRDRQQREQRSQRDRLAIVLFGTFDEYRAKGRRRFFCRLFDLFGLQRRLGDELLCLRLVLALALAPCQTLALAFLLRTAIFAKLLFVAYLSAADPALHDNASFLCLPI